MAEETTKTRKPRFVAPRDQEILVIGHCLKELGKLPAQNRVPVMRYLIERVEVDASASQVKPADPRQVALFEE